MAPLLGLLALFLVGGVAQVALAPRLVDRIHGGPGRRAERGRRFDVLVMRIAGGFVAVVAAIALVALAFLS